jgi:hypothetical protein
LAVAMAIGLIGFPVARLHALPTPQEVSRAT